jgi:hypothetical protein
MADPIEQGVEMQLRERITVLEEWRTAASEMLGLMLIGVIACAVAAAATLILLRRGALSNG